MLTQSRLKELLHYEPDTGEFTWLVRTSRRVKIGDIAGSQNGQGYQCIRIDWKPYRAHRLACLYIDGEWPEYEIDHINGVRSDNRWINLRYATRSENSQNKRASTSNNCGFIGVSRFRNKWRARIMLAGREKHLGCFPTPEDAHTAYLAAKANLHPFQPIPRDAACL